MLWDKLDTVKVEEFSWGMDDRGICFGAKEGVSKYGSPGNAR